MSNASKKFDKAFIKRIIEMEKLIIQPVWFDSLGAKSSCTLVKTPNVNVLIDPGIAAMQPSFPASNAQKREWREEGRKAIQQTAVSWNRVFKGWLGFLY